MKNETSSVATEEFVELKTKRYSFLVDDSSDHKKAKGVNKYVVEKLTHWDIKVLLTKKCLRYSMNRVQSENDNVGFYEINKNLFVLLSW